MLYKPTMPRFSTVKEGAALLRISPDTLRGMIARHEIDVVKCGRVYRISARAIEEFEARQMAPAQAQTAQVGAA